MSILTWTALGVVVGILALLVPGANPSRAIIPIVLGVVGSLAGGAAGTAAGFYEPGGPGAVAGVFLSVMGAFLAVGIYITMGGRREG